MACGDHPDCHQPGHVPCLEHLPGCTWTYCEEGCPLAETPEKK